MYVIPLLYSILKINISFEKSAWLLCALRAPKGALFCHYSNHKRFLPRKNVRSGRVFKFSRFFFLSSSCHYSLILINVSFFLCNNASDLSIKNISVQFFFCLNCASLGAGLLFYITPVWIDLSWKYITSNGSKTALKDNQQTNKRIINWLNWENTFPFKLKLRKSIQLELTRCFDALLCWWTKHTPFSDKRAQAFEISLNGLPRKKLKLKEDYNHFTLCCLQKKCQLSCHCVRKMQTYFLCKSKMLAGLTFSVHECMAMLPDPKKDWKRGPRRGGTGGGGRKGVGGQSVHPHPNFFGKNK